MVFGAMLILEKFFPRHPTVDSKLRRMGVHLTLTGVDIIAVRLVFGAAAVGAAHYSMGKNWGILNQTNWPGSLEMIFAVIVLDLSIYTQHVAVHLIPLFWRFHIVHHTDLDLDVSSGLRFHPIEILISMLYKILIVFAIGPTPMAVMVFEAILNGMSLFTHSNVKLPERLDFSLRQLLVTPDMHRIHHSTEPDETNSNYGFNLSIWDRLLGTYLQNARKPQPEILIGIDSYRSPNSVSLKNLLIMPFANPPANQSQPEQRKNL
tara:strand:- start:8 stop:796 length:789 start_codon:yes stop_codon:yes gene_type:complete